MSSPSLPVSISELIEKRSIDWKALERLALEEEGTDWRTLRVCLDSRIRTSPCPVQDAIDLFCFHPDCWKIESVVSKLEGEIFKRFSSESLVEMLAGIHERYLPMPTSESRRQFLLACRPLLDKDFARDFSKEFRVVVLKIVQLLDIERKENFFPLRILDIKEAMVRLKLSQYVTIVDWDALLDAGSGGDETDNNGNSCINYLLTNSGVSKYSVDDICDAVHAFPYAQGIPNHQGTMAMHNIFLLSGLRGSVPSKMPATQFRYYNVATFNVAVFNFPEAVVSPSPELQGKTPFHTILPDGLLATDNFCSYARFIYRPEHPGKDCIRLFLWRVKTILEDHPNVMCLVDDDGLTPLHHLMSCVCRRRLKKRHPYMKRLLSFLVSPKVARIASNDGRLPLHTALERHFDLVNELCAAAPEIAERRDPKTLLYPFQMASMDDTSRGVSLKQSDTYKLLRMAPQLVATALTDKSTAHLSTKEHIGAGKLELAAARKCIHHRRLLDEMDAARRRRLDEMDAARRRRLDELDAEYEEAQETYDREEAGLLQEAKRLRMSTSQD